MKNHFGRFLLVFVMVTLCAFAYWKKQPPLGLDLAGGSSLTYQATAAEGDLTDERMKRAISVIDGRLNATGVTEISINYTQANEIVVELPGRTDAQIKDIKSLIERNGQLQFRIEAEESEQRKYLELRKQSGGLVKPPPQYEWFPTKDGGEALIKTPEKPLLLDVLKLRKKGVAEDAPEMKAAVAKYEEAQRNEVFTGDQLVKTDIQHQTMQTVVYFEFKTERKDYFGAFTEKHVKELMAIILDGKIDSSPIINGKLPGEGVIQGGGTSGFKEAEAKSLAIVLESGSTGIQLALAREELLGPSLGEVAISRGKWSVILGFGLVVGLMVFYYRLPGMVANFALLLNLVILMGILAFFRAALTLPGIAGIVLTLGMAVDANILIFERYREERHRGKAVPEALAAGYDRAMSAIIDSNATTILTAVVLIAMGTGSVKGFGVTLTVGLLASMFTSIFVTRWIFEWAIERGIAKDLVLGPDKKTLSIDYMGNRRWFTGPSFVLMILGAVAYLVRDDYSKRDLEFVGGQEAIVHLAAGITPEDADKRVKQDKRYDEASIVTLAAEGIEALPGTTNRFRVRVKVDEFHDSLDVVVRVAKPIGADDAERRVHADKRYETAQVLALGSDDSVESPAGAGAFRVRVKAAESATGNTDVNSRRAELQSFVDHLRDVAFKDVFASETHARKTEGEVFLDYLHDTAFKGLLVSEPYTDMKIEPQKAGGVKATLLLHVVGDAVDPAAVTAALAAPGSKLSAVDVKKDAANPSVLMVAVTDPSPTASAVTVRTRVGEAVKNVQPKISLSDPFPSKSFLQKSRAEDLYRTAIWAVLVSLVIQIIYIRLRFADYNHGVAAVVALAHDVPIALGAISVCDHFGLVYAKVNLVLIAAFLTLIGYSMNDTIVVFDRIRENLGRSKVILSSLVNDAINQTLVRSIRTSMTVWVVVLIQFAFNRGTGSVLEGFAFVMVVGVLSGTYSSIFIAAPLLLFLPHYWKKFTAIPLAATGMALATLIGSILTLTSPGPGTQLWIGVPLAFCIPIHFLAYFFPWLGHENPDEFVQDQIDEEKDERPLMKPGI